MRKRCIIITAMFTVIVFLAVFHGCKQEAQLVTGPGRYMGVDEIIPGMKGFGKTVFKGDTVETFDVEIIGVMRNWSPGGNMILAEVRHNVVDEAGIIAGMSGSPIYINGRLIGALAYGWRFQKRSITGITPIQEMLVSKKGGDVRTARLFRSAGKNQPETAHITDGAEMTPLALPLVVSGVSMQFRNFVKKELNKRFSGNTVLMAGGSGGSNPDQTIKPLEEGSAVSVKLIEGDFDIAAVGTVTCIDGDTVYAFGHPFYGEGNVALPMAKAWVHTVISSLMSSFKLASTGETVGEFNFDYARGIKGTKGIKPVLVPLSISIENTDTGETKPYSFRTVHDRRWTPFLIFLAALYAIDEAKIVGMDVSAWIESTITAEGIPPIKGKGFFVTDGSPGYGSAGPLWDKIGFLMDNQYKSLSIKKVSLSIKVAGGKQLKQIERFIVDKTKVKPGDTIELILSVRQYGKPPSQEKMRIAIPDDIPEGPVRLAVYNGLFAGMHDVQRAPGLRNPESIEQIAKLFSDTYDANTMIVEFSTREQGIVIEGKEFENIPQSILDAYRGLSHPRVSPTSYRLWRRIPRERNDVLMTNISILLDVSKYHK